LSKDDFYTPTDLDALRMENELLAFEARFLRTKSAERVEELEHCAAQLKESERRLEEAERSIAQLRARLVEAERAEQDIALLLRRLANTRFGWFLGSKQNFRLLEQRYLSKQRYLSNDD
jgi:chromosome segregation ATPase